MFGLLILAALAVFIAVVAVRTSNFKPKPQPATNDEEIVFDKDGATAALAELVKCKTISYSDPALEDDAEFEKLIAKLPGLYPNVFATCDFKQMPHRGLLFKWPGKEAGEPAIMMAHYDVVPVNEENWDKPAFDAIIEDGVMWGRGTLDTKVTFNGVLYAANHLIAEGFQPQHDVYFAFSGGEEVNGLGASTIVDWFEDQGITPAMVVDEGGAVVENVFPGVKQPCGLIGIGEKGMINAQFRCMSAGGHASAPKPHTPVGILARACTRVESVLLHSHGRQKH